MEERRIVVAVDESEESMFALSWCLSNLLSLSLSPSPSNSSSSSKDSFSDDFSSVDHHQTGLIHDTATKNDTLFLLYVKPSLPVYSSLDAPGYLFAGEDVVANMEKHGRGLANSVMTRAQQVYTQYNTTKQIRVEKKVGRGDAKDVICVAVENLQADILVMGTRDYGFFKRVVLGSVSDYCAKHVKCPVVVVKRPQKYTNAY